MTLGEQCLDLLHEWTGVSMRNSMRTMLRFSREKGVSMQQIGALFRIRRGECSVRDISSELSVTAAAASQLLEGLVQQDLIRRAEDPNDRRVKQIALTDKGRRILAEGIQARQDWLRRLVQRLSPQEQVQAAAALKLLLANAASLERDRRPAA
ncbi:MAG: winged helix DNA-binding protein [Anaerolineales bacterium]|nr:winged helix DNA-binding protein [Anaerolineales bacterium]